MKAAWLEEPHSLSITDVPDPVCAPDEVILHVRRSSICNATDVHIWEGTFPKDVCPTYPHVLGHECSGEIVEVGKDVQGWKTGDRVGFWVKMTGAFGQYNAVKINTLAATKLSDAIGDDEAPLMEIVGATMRCMYKSGLELGDRVIVFGQGPTGLLLMQEAKLFGASFVATVDVYDNRLAKAKELGADFTYNIRGKTQEQARSEILEGAGPIDLVIDAMGNHRWKEGNAIDLGLSFLKRGSTYLIFGHATGDQSVNTRWVSNENITFRGFEPGWDVSRKVLRFGEQLVAQGRLNIKSLITHRLPLRELETGLIHCRDHHDSTIKVVIDVNA
jgi:2-desacetyl-2-hydroxyethyl bacteriochlorophyllide A dehydrogenase